MNFQNCPTLLITYCYCCDVQYFIEFLITYLFFPKVLIAKQNVHPACMERIVKMYADAITIHRVMHKPASVYATKVGAGKLAQIHAPMDTMA